MFKGIAQNVTKGEILDFLKNEKVGKAIENIVGELDEVLDEAAGEAGSQEIREKIAEHLERAAKVIRKDQG